MKKIITSILILSSLFTQGQINVVIPGTGGSGGSGYDSTRVNYNSTKYVVWKGGSMIDSFPIIGGSQTWEQGLINQGATPFTTDNAVDLGGKTLLFNNTPAFAIFTPSGKSFSVADNGIVMQSNTGSSVGIGEDTLTSISSFRDGNNLTRIDVTPSLIEFKRYELPSDPNAVVNFKINLDSSNANPNNVAWFDSDNILHRGYLPSGGGGGAVPSVFGRTGAVTAQANDYAASDINHLSDSLLKKINISDTASRTNVLANRTIVAWGNSLTKTIGNPLEYIDYLSALSGYNVINKGVGGNTSTQIAVRMGIVPTTATIVGGTIPSSGGVTVTFVSGYQPITLEYYNGIQGSISGVAGSLSKVDSTGTITFTRNIPGSSVSVSTATWIPDVSSSSGSLLNSPTIIWAGRNNYTDSVTVKSDIAAMVAALGHNQYIILGILNRDTAVSGSWEWTRITQLNSYLSATYGSHYIDIRTFLVNQYNPSIPQDVTDFGNDVTPTSLRADGLHLNAAGRALVAKKIFDNINILIPVNKKILTLNNLSTSNGSPTPIGIVNPNAAYFTRITQTANIQQENTPLSSEFGTSSGWITTTGWSGSYGSGFTHTTASGITSISRPIIAASGLFWQISFTVTGRTTGSFTVRFGGIVSEPYTTTNAYGPKSIIANDSIVFTPTTDFNGTISNISIKPLLAKQDPMISIIDHLGNNTFDLRVGVESSYNLYLGKSSGYQNTSGTGNTGTGWSALSANTSGYRNTGNGYATLFNNTIGGGNNAMGYSSLFNNTSGSNNNAMGATALFANTTGINNTAMGSQAAIANTTGNNNVGVGVAALSTNTTAISSTAVGFSALQFTTGSQNTGIGAYSGRSVTTGTNNVFIGINSGNNASQLVSGTNMIVFGNSAFAERSNMISFGNSSIIENQFYGSVAINRAHIAPVDALEVGGNVSLMTAGNKLKIAEGTNGSVSNTTLVAGTSTITIAGVSANTRVQLTFKSIGGTVTTTWQYGYACTTNTLTITALTNAGATNTSDTSTLTYLIIN